MTTEERLIEIEMKLTRQEDTVDVLNQAVYRQQQKIDELEGLLLAFARRLKEGDGSSADRNIDNERPPHY